MKTKTRPAALDVPRLPARYRARAVVREWIASGKLPEGEPLPSERELAEKIGVGRSAIRSAMELLQRDGLLVDSPSGQRVVFTEALKEGTPGRGTANVLASTVVVLTPHPEPNTRHRQPGWVEQLVQGCIHELRTNGFDVLAMHPDRLNAGGYERFLEAKPVGVLLPEAMGLTGGYEKSLRQLQEAGVAVVIYGRSQASEGFDRVYSDHTAGSLELTRSLIARGRRNICMSWPAVDPLPYWYEMRRQGYEQGMREAGLVPLPTLFIPEVPQDRPITAGVFALECRKQVGFFMELSRQHPPVDAVICHTDGEVPYAAWAMRRCGLEPVRDVTIAGYDHYSLEMVERAWSSDLPEVTVDKQNWLMGQEMVRLLQDRVAGRLPHEPQQRVVKPKLVELPTGPKRQA